jgi:hypothetical protein
MLLGVVDGKLQERLLGAILGAAFAGFLVFELRKSIYQPISPQNKER